MRCVLGFTPRPGIPILAYLPCVFRKALLAEPLDIKRPESATWWAARTPPVGASLPRGPCAPGHGSGGLCGNQDPAGLLPAARGVIPQAKAGRQASGLGVWLEVGLLCCARVELIVTLG